MSISGFRHHRIKTSDSAGVIFFLTFIKGNCAHNYQRLLSAPTKSISCLPTLWIFFPTFDRSFFFLFSFKFTSMTDYRYLYIHALALHPALYFVRFCFFLAVVFALPATFGLNPPLFSARILNSSFYILLSLLHLLLLKISAAVLLLFRFQEGRPATSSSLVRFPLSLAL